MPDKKKKKTYTREEQIAYVVAANGAAGIDIAQNPHWNDYVENVIDGAMTDDEYRAKLDAHYGVASK